jgi:hypothetical protein
VIHYIAAAYLLCAYYMYNAIPDEFNNSRFRDAMLALVWPLVIVTKLFDWILRA